ncbi:MAG: chorismate-binding protein [Rhabdochlamydiaceae bacterium]|nr:chorismate-binding protein [Candidatus Amphrikana amoebophyrae]
MTFPKIIMGDDFSASGTLGEVAKNSTHRDHFTFTIQDFFGKKDLTDEWEGFSSTTFIPKKASLELATQSLTLKSTTLAYSNYHQVCQSLIDCLDDTRFQKAVLATRFDHLFDTQIDPLAIFNKLQKENGLPFLYQVAPSQALVGVTPETLYERKLDQIFSEALASTALNPKDLESKKNTAEFHFVREMIEKAFRELCRTCDISNPKIKKAGKLYHLNVEFRGTLKSGVTDSEIIEILHPTPAMGGTPRALALDWILNNEPIERGFYSSYFGFLSPTYSRIMVAIRCALIKRNILSAFAGGGIVKTSDPSLEFTELENKANLWRHLI